MGRNAKHNVEEHEDFHIERGSINEYKSKESPGELHFEFFQVYGMGPSEKAAATKRKKDLKRKEAKLHELKLSISEYVPVLRLCVMLLLYYS